MNHFIFLIKLILDRKPITLKPPPIETLDRPSQELFLASIFHDFGFIWSVLMLISNFLVFIFASYWVGEPEHPGGFSLVLLIIVELFLIIDVFVQVILKRLKLQMKFFIFMEFDTRIKKIYSCMTLLSAFPIVIFFVGFKRGDPNVDPQNNFFANFLIIKLFRLWNIISFVKKFKEMLIFMNIHAMIMLKFIENFIILLISKHVSACLWMFVAKNQDGKGLFF